MSLLKFKFGVLAVSAVLIGLVHAGQAQVKFNPGVKINPGVRIAQAENRQAVPVFMQGASGGATQVTGYAAPAITSNKKLCAFGTSQTSVICAFPSAQTAGNINVVVASWEGTGDVDYASDTSYNYYASKITARYGTQNLNQAVFWSRSIAGGASNTVTVAFKAAVTVLNVQVAELNNVDAANVYDVSAAGSGTGVAGATVQTANMVTSTPTELLVLAGASTYWLVNDSNGSQTGYTNSLFARWGLLGYKVVTSTGTQQGKAKLDAGGGSDWILHALGFRAKPTTSQQPGAAATFIQANTAGNLSVAIVSWQDGTHTLSSVTDTAGNTYSAAGSTATYTFGGVTLRQAIYFAKNIAAYSSNKVTAAFSGDNTPTSPTIQILEYSGLDQTSPLDTTTSKSGTASSPSDVVVASTDAMTMATDSEVAVGGIVTTDAVDSVVVSDPTTNLRVFNPAATSRAAFDRIFQSQGGYNLAVNLSAKSQSWLLNAACFKAAGQTGVTPAPEVYSVSPGSGSTAGGETITINGENFQPGVVASFGTLAATTTYVTKGQLTAIAPAQAAGLVDIKVVNPDGFQGVLPGGYRYDLPPSYPLTVQWANTGTGGVIINPGNTSCHTGTLCQTSFSQGTSVTIVATADPGSGFQSWGLDCQAFSGNTCNLTMNASHTASVSFEVLPTGQTYSVVFGSMAPSQSPLSDSGKWTRFVPGAGQTTWPGSTKVNTNTSVAYGTMTATEGCSDTHGGAVTQCADSAAYLAGAWLADQQAMGAVWYNGSSLSNEVELHLRSQGSKLYEVDIRSANSGSSFLNFVRWNGDGTWTALSNAGCANNGASYGVAVGDWVRATVSGSSPVTLKVYYLHGGTETLKATCTDTDAAKQITSGAPGLGFWVPSGGSGANAGFTEFRATDQGSLALPSKTLNTSKTGAGTISSSPSGINCGSLCSGTFTATTPVTLTAVPDTGSIFAGWGGACSGTGTCTVTLNSDATVSASFTQQGGTGAFNIYSANQEPTSLVPYPHAFSAKRLPNAGNGGPTAYLMNNDSAMKTDLYNNRWTGYGWIASRINIYPSAEGAMQVKYYGRQDASCTDTDIANHVAGPSKVCDPAYKISNSNMRWNCYGQIFHAPSGAWFSDYGIPSNVNPYDNEIIIWDQNTDKAFGFYTNGQRYPALPACPNGVNKGTDADPCPYSGPGNNYCSYSNVTTGRLGKSGAEGQVYGSGDIESNNFGPLASSESYAERLAGHINHALYINTECTGTAGGAYPAHWVFPSTGGTAGTCTSRGKPGSDPTRPPNGALFFLDYTDAELDCLNPAKATCSGVAKMKPIPFMYVEALTYYGAYVGDTGSSGTMSISRGEAGDAYAFYDSHGFPGALTDASKSNYKKFMDQVANTCTSDWCEYRGQPNNDYLNKISNNTPVVNGRDIFSRSHFASPCVAIGLAGLSSYNGVNRCY